MTKNIVICSDGTGNTGVKGRGTNVFKLYEAGDVVGHVGGRELREQVAIYDDVRKRFEVQTPRQYDGVIAAMDTFPIPA